MFYPVVRRKFKNFPLVNSLILVYFFLSSSYVLISSRRTENNLPRARENILKYRQRHGITSNIYRHRCFCARSLTRTYFSLSGKKTGSNPRFCTALHTRHRTLCALQRRIFTASRCRACYYIINFQKASWFYRDKNVYQSYPTSLSSSIPYFFLSHSLAHLLTLDFFPASIFSLFHTQALTRPV